MKTKKINTNAMLSTISIFLLVACNASKYDKDTSGTFEATEVIVSAQSTGQILNFSAEEGMLLTAGEQIGSIDSTQLFLKWKQLQANEKSMDSRRPDIRKQIATIEQQITTAQNEKKRAENLIKANAGNQKTLDDINAQITLLQKQLDAQKTVLESTNKGITNDNEGIQYQIKQIKDQLEKCKITSPINGTMLVKYAEKGEIATPGKALFKIANLTQMTLRAYISNSQMTQIKVGQTVKVYVDYGNKSKEYSGIVSWISDKAEFTPKTIQTKDERANLVYAVKINVKNDGYLKIGMYADIKLQ